MSNDGEGVTPWPSHAPQPSPLAILIVLELSAVVPVGRVMEAR